jgi:hypothetical protein
MPTVRIPGTTADGHCTATGYLDTSNATCLVGAGSSGQQDVDQYEYHSFFFFDTSVIPSGAKIFAATLGCYFYFQYGAAGRLQSKFYLCDGDLGSTLTTADYKVGVNNGAYIGLVDGISALGQKTLSIGSSGLAQINKHGYTNVEIDAYWIGNWTAGMYMFFYTANHSTPSQRPYLDVWYKFESPQII